MFGAGLWGSNESLDTVEMEMGKKPPTATVDDNKEDFDFYY